MRTCGVGPSRKRPHELPTNRLDRADTPTRTDRLRFLRFDHLVDSSPHKGRLKDAPVELVAIERAAAVRVGKTQGLFSRDGRARKTASSSSLIATVTGVMPSRRPFRRSAWMMRVWKSSCSHRRANWAPRSRPMCIATTILSQCSSPIAVRRRSSSRSERYLVRTGGSGAKSRVRTGLLIGARGPWVAGAAHGAGVVPELIARETARALAARFRGRPIVVREVAERPPS